MFADEIADLKDTYPVRLQLVHVLSREPQEVELFSGRLDADRLRRLLPVLCDVADCRPLVAVRAVRDGHRRHGRAGRARRAGGPGAPGAVLRRGDAA